METIILEQLKDHQQRLVQISQNIAAYRQAMQQAEAEALATTGAIAALEEVLRQHQSTLAPSPEEPPQTAAS